MMKMVGDLRPRDQDDLEGSMDGRRLARFENLKLLNGWGR